MKGWHVPQEVKDDGIHHAVRQGILLVQQRLQEDAVCPIVVHLSNFQYGSSRVKHGDGALSQNTGQNDGFSQRTVPSLKLAKALITELPHIAYSCRKLFICPLRETFIRKLASYLIVLQKLLSEASPRPVFKM